MTSQRGFSLVEALIALLVLSLGLVGVAAMQLKALQSASLGYQRSVASVAAADAQERLWATLEPGQGCDAIDVGAVQTDWRDQWFEDSDHTPCVMPLKATAASRKTVMKVRVGLPSPLHLAKTLMTSLTIPSACPAWRECNEAFPTRVYSGRADGGDGDRHHHHPGAGQLFLTTFQTFKTLTRLAVSRKTRCLSPSA